MSHRVELGGLKFRVARSDDAPAIAALHADSWRRHYRGALSDAFLDGEVFEDRRAVWTERLQEADEASRTVLAEWNGDLVGFAHTVFDADPTWGALLDNLHVIHTSQRLGVGSRLLGLTADAVIERQASLYLWVLEQNRRAQAFYEAHGGVRVQRTTADAHGRRSSRRNGSPGVFRYAWPDPAIIRQMRQRRA
jgi:GNAT superfamily N-acetyltransferase